MNAFKMNSDTLLTFAFDILDNIETELSNSIYSSNKQICDTLTKKLYLSIEHIRDIFKLTTNMSLCKYITRRRYAIIISRLTFEKFNKLSKDTTLCGINKFKKKCLHEFPTLANNYSLESMQPPLDHTRLHKILNEQINKKGEAYLMKTLYKDIIKGRTPIEITDPENIILQTQNDTLINLERTYFLFKDTVFKITATIDTSQNASEEPFLSLLFGQSIYHHYSISADANMIVHTLHQFLTGHQIKTNGFSINIEWANQYSWETNTLISLMSFEHNKLKEVKFTNNPFLTFNKETVVLNLPFH